MTRPHPSIACLAAALMMAASAASGAEQPAPPPSKAPSPAEANPLSTTTSPDPSSKPPGTAMPVPDKALAPSAPPGGAPARPSAPVQRQTLVPARGEPSDVEDVTLPAKPAAILSGKSTWEDAVANLKASFATIEAGLAKAGIRATGRPLAVFDKSGEKEFEYEAMIPIEAAPAPGTAAGEGVTFGSTPSGRALRFKHAGTYDEISGTYDTLIAYFDAKDIAVQDRFIEEYVTDLSDAADERLDVNIYALPK